MSTSPTPEVSEGYRRYLLGLMMLCQLFNYLDRQLPAILLPSIKQDFQLTDTQLGFITGLAFAVFYATVGIPLGRLSDSVSRRKLLTVCIAVWSAATAATGAATSFVTMACARFAVGMGEAGLIPCAHSLVSDVYPAKRRASAFGILAAGTPFGALLAFVGGGWITEVFGWRVAFFALGLPGLILAALVYFTVKETTRGGIDGLKDSGKPPPLAEVFRTLFRIPAFWHCCLGTSFTGLVYSCIQAWVPSFLVRSFGMSIGEIGSWLAPGVAAGGLIGTIMGGRLADKLAAGDERWRGFLPAITTGSGALIGTIAFAADTWWLAVLMISFPLLLCPVHLPIYGSILQSLAPLRMRGAFPTISLFIASMVGVGIGPQIVGLVSDWMRVWAGEESLRYALMAVIPFFGVWASIHFILGGRYIPEDFAKARAANT